MKIIIIVFFTIIISFFLILLIKGGEIKEIKTEIEIKASPQKVWDILIDINRWNEWNPTVNKVDGNIKIGNKINIVMRDEDGKDGAKYTPIITQNNEPLLLEWHANMISDFFFSNDRIFELRKSNNGTFLINKEIFKGLLVPLFWNKFNDYVPSILKKMNIALKEEVENK